MLDEKIYFNPGDMVTVKNIDGPIMVVKAVDKLAFKDNNRERSLLGITCFWFTKNFEYQETRFNTKDLIKC